ncbi:MAG: gamma carbonic anhydrase family protein [Candidatus Thermoplasmatota archaeon]|nr:gamma carbonic anhydrase family protein [Candidatus Thermoplasmatota archaeon]
MAIYEFEGRRPTIGIGTWVAPDADIIGRVIIGKDCYIGPGAKIKGDYGTITIGDKTSIQENCVLHARPEEITEIGNMVTVGHGAIIHGGRLDDYCIIGMGAIVSDHAVVGQWAVVAEGAVVRNRQEIQPEAIVAGVPAKPIGQIDQAYKDQWTHYKELYAQLACERYPQGLKAVDISETRKE